MVSMERWVGKVAVVTGASSGIGAGIAERLVKEGLKVVGLARRVELIEKHAKHLSNEKGQLYAIKTDITKENDILSAFDWISKNLGPVHILVNSTGVMIRNSLTSGKTEDWKTTFDTNVMGLCIATREAIKIMQSNKIDGHIIHINSILARTVGHFPDLSVYPSTKFAVTALAETLRQELVRTGSKIRVTLLNPGMVVSEMTTLNKNASAELLKTLRAMPILQTEDIADGIIYVLSAPPHVQIAEITIKPVGEIF